MSIDIPVSTVPTVLAQLFTDITAQIQNGPSGSEVLVCYGEPGMYAPDDIIQINTNVRRTVIPRELMGNYQTESLKESYDIELLCSSWSGSTDQLVALNRAYDLVGYVEYAVRNDPTFGVIVDAFPSGSSGGAPTPTPDPVGWLSELTMSISCVTLN